MCYTFFFFQASENLTTVCFLWNSGHNPHLKIKGLLREFWVPLVNKLLQCYVGQNCLITVGNSMKTD